MMRPLNTANVFKKQIASLILIFFTFWAAYNSYSQFTTNSSIKATLAKKSNLGHYFKNDVGTVYKDIAELLVEKDILIANDQKFNLLKKEDNKSYLSIDYDLSLRNDFVDTINLLDKFNEKKLIYRISDLSIQKRSDKSSNLDIKLKFKALAYEKNS